MANPTTTTAPAAQAMLTCRLRRGRLRRGGSALAGEVELENASGRVLEIEADRHPLQYLDLVVTDAAGSVISEGHYADIFSPLGKTCTLRLAPGETYRHNVSLLGTVREECRQPGHYSVQAVYEYRGLKAISEPLSLQLPAQEGGEDTE